MSVEKPPAEERASKRNPTVVAAWITGAVTIIAAVLSIVLPKILNTPASQSPTPTSQSPTPTSQSPTSASQSPTSASQSLVQLKSSYTGTATGFANGFLSFSVSSEDSQGNVILEVIFTNADTNKQANYSCNGNVTSDKHISLKCTQDDASNFLLDIEGSIYQDGHMQGSMVATNTFDASYRHNYAWNVT
jgi:hypothetical protein